VAFLSDGGIAADSDIMETVLVLSVCKHWIHYATRMNVTMRYNKTSPKDWTLILNGSDYKRHISAVADILILQT
jgi:hypothetical protein